MAVSDKRVYSPAFTGLSCTALLIVSRFLVQYSAIAPEIGALNTVLRIIAMCECVHLVRTTSAKKYTHVWDNTEGLLVFSMPVVNLLVTAVQLFAENSTVLSNRLFTAVLTLFSLPAFFCYYFAFYFKITGRGRKGLVMFFKLSGIVYTVIRILDKAFFPFLIKNRGIAVPEFLLKIVSFSTSVSFGVFIAAAFGFLIIAILGDKKHRL